MGEVTTTLPESLENKLEERHESTGISKSEIIRQALLEKFNL